MNDHVTATLDGAVPTTMGAMRWKPPPRIDLPAALRACAAAIERVVAVIRRFLDDMTLAFKEITNVLHQVAQLERARLSAMRREYHRRRR